MTAEGVLFTRKDLTRLIGPLIIEQFLAVAVGAADVMMVASVGEAAVSGVSLVDMINILIINLFAALATGGAVVSAQYLGAHDREKACGAASQLLFLTFGISVVAAGICLAIQEPLLRAVFGSIDNEVMDSAITYFWLSALSYPFIGVYNSCAALFRSMGNSKISMLTSLIMNILNVIGNAIFIFVFHWGVAGAAGSSLISRIVAAVVMVVLVRNPHNEIYIRSLRAIRPNLAQIKKILHIGIPSGLENSLFQIGKVMVGGIISVYGTVQIAANAVAGNIASMSTIPGAAIGLAMITIVGQCVGARDYVQAERYAKKLIKLILICEAACFLVIGGLSPLLVKIYNLSPETAALTQSLILLHCAVGIFIWALSFSLPNVLRAANDVRYTMGVSVISMMVFRVLFSYVLGLWMGMGAWGVWIAMMIDWAVRALLFSIRFAKGKWKLQKI